MVYSDARDKTQEEWSDGLYPTTPGGRIQGKVLGEKGKGRWRGQSYL